MNDFKQSDQVTATVETVDQKENPLRYRIPRTSDYLLIDQSSQEIDIGYQEKDLKKLLHGLESLHTWLSNQQIIQFPERGSCTNSMAIHKESDIYEKMMALPHPKKAKHTPGRLQGTRYPPSSACLWVPISSFLSACLLCFLIPTPSLITTHLLSPQLMKRKT